MCVCVCVCAYVSLCVFLCVTHKFVHVYVQERVRERSALIMPVQVSSCFSGKRDAASRAQANCVDDGLSICNSQFTTCIDAGSTANFVQVYSSSLSSQALSDDPPRKAQHVLRRATRARKSEKQKQRGWKTQGRGNISLNPSPKTVLDPAHPTYHTFPPPRCVHAPSFSLEEAAQTRRIPLSEASKTGFGGARYSPPPKLHDTFCPPPPLSKGVPTDPVCVVLQVTLQVHVQACSQGTNKWA